MEEEEIAPATADDMIELEEAALLIGGAIRATVLQYIREGKLVGQVGPSKRLGRYGRGTARVMVSRQSALDWAEHVKRTFPNRVKPKRKPAQRPADVPRPEPEPKIPPAPPPPKPVSCRCHCMRCERPIKFCRDKKRLEAHLIEFRAKCLRYEWKQLREKTL